MRVHLIFFHITTNHKIEKDHGRNKEKRQKRDKNQLNEHDNFY